MMANSGNIHPLLVEGADLGWLTFSFSRLTFRKASSITSVGNPHLMPRLRNFSISDSAITPSATITANSQRIKSVFCSKVIPATTATAFASFAVTAAAHIANAVFRGTPYWLSAPPIASNSRGSTCPSASAMLKAMRAIAASSTASNDGLINNFSLCPVVVSLRKNRASPRSMSLRSHGNR